MCQNCTLQNRMRTYKGRHPECLVDPKFRRFFEPTAQRMGISLPEPPKGQADFNDSIQEHIKVYDKILHDIRMDCPRFGNETGILLRAMTLYQQEKEEERRQRDRDRRRGWT